MCQRAVSATLKNKAESLKKRGTKRGTFWGKDVILCKTVGADPLEGDV